MNSTTWRERYAGDYEDKLETDMWALKSDSESAPAAEEKKVLLKVEKNVYHRKTLSPIVIAEVCIFRSKQNSLL